MPLLAQALPRFWENGPCSPPKITDMKVLMICAGAVVVFALASCDKKNHTCVCFNNNNEITHTYTYSDMDRQEARSLCAESAVLLNEADSLGQTYICTLEQE